jgi:hypothetical protein
MHEAPVKEATGQTLPIIGLDRFQVFGVDLRLRC